MQTCPCDVDPFTPHFSIVKLGFTGVLIFLIFARKLLYSKTGVYRGINLSILALKH